MSSQLDIGAFLAEQSAVGEVDSQGDFTVSHNEAVRKLARFALPRMTAWVSKLVQAAVRWRCMALHLTQSGAETNFHFVMNEGITVPNEQEILGALVSATVTGPRAVDAFGLALRGLVEQARYSFLLVCESSEGVEPKRIYAGAHYGGFSEQQRMASRYVRPGGISLTVYHYDRPNQVGGAIVAAKQAREIVEELRAFAYMAPIPLTINGENLEGPLNTPALGYSSSLRPLVLSGLSSLDHSPPQLPLPSGYEEKILSLLSHPRRILRGYGGKRYFSAAFLMTFRTESGAAESYRRSRLLWLLDGIIVDEEEIGARDALELYVYANAADLKTDLTGFRLVETEEYRLRRSEILSRMVRAIDDPVLRHADFLREDRDGDSPSDDVAEKDDVFRRRARVVLAGGGAGVALMCLTPVPILGALVIAGTALGARSFVGGTPMAMHKRYHPRQAHRLSQGMQHLRDILERTVEAAGRRGWTKDRRARAGAEFDALEEEEV